MLLGSALRAHEAFRAASRSREPARPATASVNDAATGRLDLEGHGGRTAAGVVSRALQPPAPAHRGHLAQRAARGPTVAVRGRRRPPMTARLHLENGDRTPPTPPESPRGRQRAR